MNNATAPADLIDAAASFADDEALDRAMSEVDDLVGHEASSTAEVVHNLLASLAYLLTAARRDAHALPAALSIYKLAAATLATWRLDLHAECWADVVWSAEVEAAFEADQRRHQLRADLIEAAAGVDGATYRAATLAALGRGPRPARARLRRPSGGGPAVAGRPGLTPTTPIPETPTDAHA